MTEHSIRTEIDVGSQLCAMAFTTDGKYIVGSDWEKVRVWQAEDGKHIATTETGLVFCLAVSKNSRWIAAGTLSGDVIMLDATTYEKVFSHSEDVEDIHGVDFSPDSTRLAAASRSGTATILDLVTRKQVQTLQHEHHVIAAKYSPYGGQIATATPVSVHVWDGDEGSLLVDIPVAVAPLFNTGLVWFQNSHILVASDSEIKKFDASTGSIVLEWPVLHTDRFSYISIPRHREFIIHATNHTVAFWDSSTHSQLDLSAHHYRNISSVARSHGDRFLAVCGGAGKITIESLSHIADSIPSSRLHCAFQELDIQLHNTTFDPCKHDQIASEEASLTTAIHEAQNPSNHALASRALLRARLQRWEAALADAEMAIDIQPSVIGFIAKSMAHIGIGERHKAYQACDVAFEYFHSSHGTFLLLIKAIIMSLAGEHRDASSRMDDLIAADPVNSICYVVQAYIHLLLGNSLMEHGDYEDAVRSLKRARTKMRHHTSRPLAVVSLISGWKFDNLGVTIRQRLGEALYAAGRSKDAGESLLEMVTTFDEEVYSGPVSKWVSDFAQQCLSAPDNDDNAASNPTSSGNPRVLHDARTPLLKEWTKATLTVSSWKDALVTAASFEIPKVAVYQAICTHLKAIDRITDAVECFHQMTSELGAEMNLQGQHREWAHHFSQRSFETLKYLGDTEADAQRYDEAIFCYTTALSLNPPSPQDILFKRSKAFVATGLWKQALDDVDQMISLDPSSPWGYEIKRAALHAAGDYDGAVHAFETMLEKIRRSPHPDVQRQGDQYISPSSTRATIRKIVQKTTNRLPHELIDTTSGCLHNRAKQASAFESSLIFNELVSSTTTRIDYVRIKREVRRYFRYVMLSHKWEDNEPLFQEVLHISVYDLNQSSTHVKLQTFCEIVRDAGFIWAWSDTCCINQSNHFVLQEALVAMFQWYQGSALTIVYLRGVRTLSQLGALMKSIWNTRAWTLQEYIAAKVVHFYTEDWTPYLNLPLSNHKESQEVILEMKEATGVSAKELMALRPGLSSIREKLRLASTRQTTLVEDAAYSLLGIFSASGISAIYGEREGALGRLLANILTRSGDVSILAWTGESGPFNSCLPAHITVFTELATSHLPPHIPDAEIGAVSAPHVSRFSLDAALKLYNCLSGLATPKFAESRMTLSCIAFRLPRLQVSPHQTGPVRVYYVDTPAFGMVEVTTKQDLSRMATLYLVHPWLESLLEHEDVQSGAFEEDNNVSSLPTSMDDEDISDREIDHEEPNAVLLPHEPESPTRSLHHQTAPMDNETRARRLAARLRLPFGALLLTLMAAGRRVVGYKRVAADSMVQVQFREDFPLDGILDKVRTFDVL